MRSWRFTAAALAFGTCLSGCVSATMPTRKVAVDYNHIFAASRDEVLVTNILRASAHEPLEFSTMGAVTGGVRNSGAVEITIPDMKPKITFNDGINPSVTIVPLADKEFAQGLLNPVSLATVNLFLGEGWDPEFILQMVVGGIVCPDTGAVVRNTGIPEKYHERATKAGEFDEMFGNVPRLPVKLREKTADDRPQTLKMPAKEALALLKAGIGEGNKISSIRPVYSKGRITGDALVEFKPALDLEFTGLKTSAVCADIPAGPHMAAVLAAVKNNDSFIPIDGGKRGWAMLRSPEAIIYFLGETHRSRSSTDCLGANREDPWPQYYRLRDYGDGRGQITEWMTTFHLETVCPGKRVPANNMVWTRFEGRDYFIVPRKDPTVADGPMSPSPCQMSSPGHFCDRTMTTLSFLNELIALQTSGSTIASTKPLIAIPEK